MLMSVLSASRPMNNKGDMKNGLGRPLSAAASGSVQMLPHGFVRAQIGFLLDAFSIYDSQSRC